MEGFKLHEIFCAALGDEYSRRVDGDAGVEWKR